MKVKHKRVFSVVMGIILWMLSPFFVYGQLLDPVSFSLNKESVPESVVNGQTVQILIQAEIEDEWHLYALRRTDGQGPVPTTFHSSGGDIMIAGDIIESDPDRAYDPNFDNEVYWHSGQAEFRIPVRFLPGKYGRRQVQIGVTYQACDDISCLPPVTRLVQFEMSVNDNQAQGTVHPESMAGTYSQHDSDFGFGTRQAFPGQGDDLNAVPSRLSASHTIIVFSITLLAFLMVNETLSRSRTEQS